MFYKNLLVELSKKKIKYHHLALILGINRNTVSHKINGVSDFTVTEAIKIYKDVFQETYSIDYLFTQFDKEEV